MTSAAGALRSRCPGSRSMRTTRPVTSGSVVQASDSASSQPTTRTTSAARSQRWTAARCSPQPRLLGCDSGSTPLPLVLVTAGQPSASTRARAWALAPRAPPPRTTAGRSAPASSAAAARASSGSTRGRSAAAGTNSSSGTSSTSSSRSSAISRCQGRGRLLRNAVKASRTASAAAAGVSTRTARSTTAASAACWSRASCSRPVARRGCPVGIPGEMASTGEESLQAWASAVAALRIPGPVVANSTPGRPDTRA